MVFDSSNPTGGDWDLRTQSKGNVLIISEDRDSRDPLELLDEVETVLKIRCAPLTWPIGSGKHFRGVYHLLHDRVHFFSARHGGRIATGEMVHGLHDPALDARLGEQAAELREQVELVRGASDAFDPGAYLAGEQTPVFFGSAINNFGVDELLDAFVEHAPAPSARAAVERSVEPELDIHVILDNYATHKHEAVRRWLERNPRVHFHFVPTGGSWLNLVERFFSELTERQLRRLAVTSVAEL